MAGILKNTVLIPKHNENLPKGGEAAPLYGTDLVTFAES